MRFTVLFLFLLFTGFTGLKAQITLHNKSLTEPDLQLMYAGRANSIVFVNADPKKNYSLKSTGSAVQKITDKEYTIIPSFYLSVDTLILLENGIEFKREIFRVLNMPISVIQIANLTPIEKTASKETLINNPKLELINNSLYVEEETIVSFEFNIYNVSSPDSIIFSTPTTEGYTFTTEQINAIKNSNSGERLVISRIIVVDGKGNKYVNRGRIIIIE